MEISSSHFSFRTRPKLEIMTIPGIILRCIECFASYYCLDGMNITTTTKNPTVLRNTNKLWMTRNFPKTFPAQKQRKCMSCNVSNKDQLHFEYETEVDLDRCSMRQLEVLEMKINTQDQADKIKQLDNANTKKDRDIQKLKNRDNELSGKIYEQEAQIQFTKETTDEQKSEIERLKCELSKMKTGSENNDKTTINNAGNIQINQTNSNGAQHTHRQTFPVKKVNPVFEDGRRHKHSHRFRMQRGHGTCRQEKTE
ncbi:unnamed protein product [Mytilus coruscus]|uniref:Uncharacterized protein n=1 Tax=Mytilus coruscus TaxID=42192 RepID=A0A6J8CGQ6_MYTCO|nr:unnamed protein product [Mytilus coruscus]